MKKTKHRKVKIKSVAILVTTILLLISLSVIGYLFLFAPKVVFKENPAALEINEAYNNKQFVSELKRLSWDDIKVKGRINTKKLGTYQLNYVAGNHSFKLNIDVKDTKKPVVVPQEQSISINTTPKADSFIKDIKDATKTTVSFKEKYSFDKLGDKTIILIVQDEGNNKTEVKTVVHILPKDTTPPVINVHDFEMVKGKDIDVLSGISAQDDRDGKVEVKADTSNFNKDAAGVYTITYMAIDKTGNKATASAKVTVVEPGGDGDKVIYLTIDDGPSQNTPKILEILNRYNVKATFFVTAQYPGYASFIHDEFVQGHAIGLHTYSHQYEQLYANDAAYFADLQAISDLVKAQTGVESHIIRFPGGSSNTISANYNIGIMSRLSKAVTARGYQYYDWNSASGDGNSGVSAASLIAQSKQFAGQSPLIFLTHDHGGSNASVEALPAIIEYYKSLGYKFKVLTTATPAYHHNVNN